MLNQILNRYNNSVLLAVGLEDGEVLLYQAKQANFGDWTLGEKIYMSVFSLHCNCFHAHFYRCAGSVERLSWRPIRVSDNRELAVASSDRSIRIVKVGIYR
jgi:hypothetical protein